MPERPSGTVTFLFTDIEGSTQLWEQFPEAMRLALAHHDTLLRQAIEAHGGTVFKTVGDAFCAAFATAPAALAAALAAQRALEDGRRRTEDEGPSAEDEGRKTEDGGQDGTLSSLSSVHRPPSFVTLRVRMGLHTGLAEERDGDYFGPPLNRVARLMSAASGGQVLLSLPTYELVRDLLPASVSLRDLGEHRLKDLIRPERVYQLVAPDLPADFPPIKSLSTHPNNLPAQMTALLGREAETRQVASLLQQANVRLITLTGPGGTGKTRLALQVAADLLHHFAQGVFFVDLAPITDPALVPSAIAAALDVREQPGQPLLDTLKDFLREKQLLLVLDNFEQVVAATRVVADLLAAAPRLKVIVTSREVLHLRGEHEYPVPPLALPPLADHRPPTADGRTTDYRLPTTDYASRITQYAAVALFIERAVAVKPDFQVTNANAPAVAEICYRLDGLPLAIELAAARVKLFPPQTLLQRLGSRLKTLTGGARDLPSRQQALRAAIDWSYDLLTPGEQALFRRLGVFVGGATLEAVEAVCADDEPEGGTRKAEGGGETSLLPTAYRLLPSDILDGLQSLVDKSLVRAGEGVGGEPRFVMLETIREYGLERLAESGEAERLRAGHADYFMGLAEQAEPEMAGSGAAAWMDRLEEEHDNLRAALEWSAASGQTEEALRIAWAIYIFWRTRGHWSEARTWYERLLAQRAETPLTPTYVKILWASAGLYYVAGQYSQSEARLEQTLAVATSLNEKGLMARSLSYLGLTAGIRGDLQRRAECHEQSLALFREVGDKWGISGEVFQLGNVAWLRRDLERARRLYNESLALARNLGEQTLIGLSLCNLGNVALDQGDYPAAQRGFEAALEVFEAMNHRLYSPGMIGNLGHVAFNRGDEGAARRLLTDSLARHRDLDPEHPPFETLLWLGLVTLYEGDQAEAERLLRDSLEVATVSGELGAKAEALSALGAALFRDGQPAQAAAQFRAALAVAQEMVGVPFDPVLLIGPAVVAAETGGEAGALKAARLLGAVDASLAATGQVPDRHFRDLRDHALAAARARLIDAAFAQAWAEGQAMTLEEAVQYALETEDLTGF